MKGINFILIWSIVSLFSCNSNMNLPKDPCKKYDEILEEFASKFEIISDNCYVYDFEKDTIKYIQYNEFGGKTNFMDYRLNEILYYQHNLTNEFLSLSANRKLCQQKLNKQDIINLFGNSYDYNNHYRDMSYSLCNPNDDVNSLNFIQFRFRVDEVLESFVINIYQF